MESKIKTYLFTQGNELIIESTQENYTGWYNIDSENMFYTEKVFDSGKSLLLLPKEDKKTPYEKLIKSRDVLNVKKQIDIQSYYPIITESNIQLGYVDRYFARKLNVDNLYLKEIDLNTFLNLDNKTGIYLDSLYNTYHIRWYIAGNLIEVTNKNKEEIKKNPILNNLLKDLNEFFQK